jgi:hypothetical protein
MEVHAPEHAIHTWRDFFVHIATITIGLLIAIGLEPSVEWLHHRHLVHQARESIRGEIAGNEKVAATDMEYLQRDADLMKIDLAKARQLRVNPHSMDHHGEFASTYSWSTFRQSAWTSAHESGALTYMPVEEVQAYDDLYLEQEQVTASADGIFKKQLELVTPFVMEDGPTGIRPDDVQQLVRDTALAYLRLSTLRQILTGLQKIYADTLKE